MTTGSFFKRMLRTVAAPVDSARMAERRAREVIELCRALLSERDCRALLQKHVGPEVAFSKTLLTPASRKDVIVRMLLNLKRIYVHMRSFPQARDVTEVLVSLNPSALTELRDRGLLAYHLNDVTGALRDLQTYLKLTSLSEMDQDEREEHDQIWEHVKTLRRRVAALN